MYVALIKTQQMDNLFQEGNILVDDRFEYNYTLRRLVGRGAHGQAWAAQTNDPENPNAIIKIFVKTEKFRDDQEWKDTILPEYIFAKWANQYSAETGLPNPCKDGSICAIRMFQILFRGFQIAVIVFANKGAIDLHQYYHDKLFPELRKGNQEFVNRQGLRIAAGLMRCIKVLHRLGAIHSDIKPSNVVAVLDGFDEVKGVLLIDFGLWCTPRGKAFIRAHGITNYSTECPEFNQSYYFLTTPQFADPESRDWSGTQPAMFSEKEHLEKFKKFDLFAAAVTIWYAWAPDEYEQSGKRTTAIDPVSLSKYTPKFQGYILPQGTEGLGTLSLAILSELGVLCFLFSKMSGPLNARLPPQILESMFMNLAKFKG